MNKIQLNNKKERLLTIIIIIFYVCYGFSCAILYYRQSIQYGGEYYSDLVAHIRSGGDGKSSYSIAYKILGVLYDITDNTKLIAIYLSVVSLLTVWATYEILKFFVKMQKIYIANSLLHICSILCCFAMSINIPYIYPNAYIGTITGQAWHNSTYLQMKLLGIFIIFLYFKMRETYMESISISQAIVFIGSLIFINMIKPNFILAFAPMMAICLAIDLFTAKTPLRKRFRQIILFGSCVLPSLIVLLVQNQILYKGNSDGGIAIDIGYSFLRTGNPYAKILLGLAFPLIVLIFNYKDLIYDKIYGSVWLMWIISFVEYGVFIETGKRQNHGNFAWGMIFCTFLLFVISIYKLICNRDQKKNNITYYYISLFILVLHVLSGMYYFLHLLRGGTYLI